MNHVEQNLQKPLVQVGRLELLSQKSSCLVLLKHGAGGEHAERAPGFILTPWLSLEAEEMEDARGEEGMHDGNGSACGIYPNGLTAISQFLSLIGCDCPL